MANTKKERGAELKARIEQSKIEAKQEELEAARIAAEAIANGDEEAKEIIKQELIAEVESREFQEDVKEEVVEVKLSILEEMRKEQQLLRDKVSFLEQVQDKGRVSNFLSKNKKQETPIIKIRLYNGHVVLSWRTIEDDVYSDMETGKIISKQTISLILDKKGEKVEEKVSLVAFNRNFKHQECRLVSTRTIGNETYYTLERIDNGDVVEINTVYVN